MDMGDTKNISSPSGSAAVSKAPSPPIDKKLAIAKLMDLCRQGKFTQVKDHFHASPEDFHVRDEADRLPIHWSVSGGHLELTKFLLSILSDEESIESFDDMGWTPLMIGSSAGHKDVVKFLLESGANPKHRNHNRQTSLLHAASKNHPEIAVMLLEKGAEVNAYDKYGSSPLHRAAAQGKAKMVSLLLSQPKININSSDVQKNTPLHMACEEKRTEVAIMLVKKGAHLDTLNEDEKTPLELAEKGLRNTLQRLAETG